MKCGHAPYSLLDSAGPLHRSAHLRALLTGIDRRLPKTKRLLRMACVGGKGVLFVLLRETAEESEECPRVLGLTDSK